MTREVLADWRTAPVEERLRAALGLLETMTLRPEQLTPADIDLVRAAGVSEEAIVDAVLVCGLFNAIDRIADGLGFAVPPVELRRQVAPLLLEYGYRPPGS